jgi:hypothetical protein
VKLTTLQLDNNIIEKIEGLDMLVNLEWLGKIQFKRPALATNGPFARPVHVTQFAKKSAPITK